MTTDSDTTKSALAVDQQQACSASVAVWMRRHKGFPKFVYQPVEPMPGDGHSSHHMLGWGRYWGGHGGVTFTSSEYVKRPPVRVGYSFNLRQFDYKYIGNSKWAAAAIRAAAAKSEKVKGWLARALAQ